MSPLSLRRYRAERLLREQFQALHSGVIAAVARRLRARGVRAHDVDLEACYAQAWHALYASIVSGREIANPAGWLALVTYRRAIDEHRARWRPQPGPSDAAASDCARRAPGELGVQGDSSCEPDLAAELDDRERLRQLFEGLRRSLGGRELQAATLCYLHGLSRAQAAARMGLSDARMRKLMEGHGPGRPGVARKVGELVATIRDGDWCEEQGSLMRGLALGVLDPRGERYRLAQAHRDRCPACRAYVRSLRGLAAVLPPLPALLRWVLDSTRGATAAGGGVGHGAGIHAGRPHGPASPHAGLPSGAGAPPVSTTAGAGGAGAAGGGWLVAGGGAATKLAVGCVLAAGLSAGCVALTLGPVRRAHPRTHRPPAHRAALAGGRQREVGHAFASALPAPRAQPARGGAAHGAQTISPAARASHEFGPEQPATPVQRASAAIPAHAVVASAPGSTTGSAQATGGSSVTRPASRVSAGGGSSSAQREFGIG